MFDADHRSRPVVADRAGVVIDGPPPPLTYILGILLFVVATLLLTSVGGAGVVAAPVTLLLMVIVVWHHPTLGFRISGALIGGLTAAEGTWGVVYASVGGAPVAIWMLPLACGFATAFGFTAIGRDARSAEPRT